MLYVAAVPEVSLIVKNLPGVVPTSGSVTTGAAVDESIN